MAKHLRENIQPGEVTIDNIENFQQQTTSVLQEIQDDDIQKFEQNINNLEHIFDKNMRIISSSQPIDPEKGMAWFIKTQEEN